MENLDTVLGSQTDGGLSAVEFLARGGPILWLIFALSVLALTIIFWKVLRFWSLGVWADKRPTEQALSAWQAGDTAGAAGFLSPSASVRATVATSGFDALTLRGFGRADAEDEIARVAKAKLAEGARGLKLLDIIATVAPLLGLLGTVVGMIAAFQAMQAAGARVDPAMLAGGIWQALLTTAAGMAVAIPATMALGWFESVLDRLRLDLEDIGTRILQPRQIETALTEAAE